jgi:uncharacterized membrane protein
MTFGIQLVQKKDRKWLCSVRHCRHIISSEKQAGARRSEELMSNQQVKIGVWFYGLGVVLTGILDIAWQAFDASHQPIKVLGKIPGQNVLACVAGAWFAAAGLAILWRRSVKYGAAASAIAYSMMSALWLLRYYFGIHALGWRVDVLAGVSFGLAQQLMLVSPAVILYASAVSEGLKVKARVAMVARWMLGLPPIVFGLLHLIGIRVFARMVPAWMHLGYFGAAITGIAFILAGLAICLGTREIPAARLLWLMLLLFEGLVEIPPLFMRSHDQGAWGAAVYNLPAIGACWIFAEFLARREDREGINTAEDVAGSRPDRVLA